MSRPLRASLGGPMTSGQQRTGTGNEYEQLNKALHSRVLKWEKQWTSVGRIRVYKWMRTEEIAGADSDQEKDEEDNGTPGIVEVERKEQQDFNDLMADVEDVHEMEKVEELVQLEREADPDADVNLIEQEAARHAHEHSE